MLKHTLLAISLTGLSGCGVAYIAPSMQKQAEDGSVQIVPLSAETISTANSAAYTPKSLPDAFHRHISMNGGIRGAGALPESTYLPQTRPGALETRLPPAADPGPYRIGVGDVLVLATPQGGSTVAELSGLLAAQNRRQGYTVQDDGSIAVPDVGRIPVEGRTLKEAESAVFEKLLDNQIDPSFSLEIAEFNSKRVTVGGAVGKPTVVPVQLSPMMLEEVIAAAGGVQLPDIDYATIRIYRDGTLYQIPVKDLYQNPKLKRTRVIDGDVVFVDTEYELAKAEGFFRQQIEVAGLRSQVRSLALQELNAEFQLRNAALTSARETFTQKLELGAVDRDFVYVTGEVVKQTRLPMPFEGRMTLADALYDAGGVAAETGNPSQIYVLRSDKAGKVTAWHLDARNAVNFTLATRMEMRPSDVVFVEQQPITKWNRVIQQFVPSMITTPAAAAAN